MYKEKYYKGSLTEEQAEELLKIQSEEKDERYRKVIKNLTEEEVKEVIEEAEKYEKEKGSLEGYIGKQYEREGELRDYQTKGVAFMYASGSAILGDEVGLGKTVQIAGLCNVLKREEEGFRYIFLTEKSNVGQIRSKLVQFSGEYVGLLENGEEKTVRQYVERNKEKKNYSVVGCHSLLTSSVFLSYILEKPYDLIVVDESSVLKNVTSTLYKSAKGVLRKHKRVIELNATPLEQELREFYNQLNLLEEGYMPSLSEFERDYCKKTRGTFGGYVVSGYKNGEVFKEAVKLRYLARTREELGARYEGNKYEMVVVPLSKEQKELMKRTSLYQMVTDYPKGVDKRIECTRETTPKLEMLMRIIERGGKEERYIIYSNYIESQEVIKRELEKEGYSVVILNGQKKAKERTEIIEDYNKGKYNIIVTNVKKGVDLKNCNVCILYTIDPNPQKMVQVEGRITRGFDIKEKKLYLLVSEGREKKFVEKVLGTRVSASQEFTKSGKSMVLQAIGKVSGKKGEVKYVQK